MTTTYDPVDSPEHYVESLLEGFEPIDFTRHLSFSRGNAFKYVARYLHKGAPVQDLRKARFYVQDAIAFEEPREARFPVRLGGVLEKNLHLALGPEWHWGAREAILYDIVFAPQNGLPFILRVLDELIEKESEGR